MEERIASYLSLANKAGRVVSGSDLVMQVLQEKTAKAGSYSFPLIFRATYG